MHPGVLYHAKFLPRVQGSFTHVLVPTQISSFLTQEDLTHLVLCHGSSANVRLLGVLVVWVYGVTLALLEVCNEHDKKFNAEVL